ncbi:alpha-N-acetyl-neuraminyl-2,3-beta-galactosyl-1,3-N-acetyl-galactosaminide alpha-2,6-sialyltransferase-like isoform X2 [Apostichopus japonicus]
MERATSDLKFRWRVRDLIILLAFWQCILMTLCLLYFLHNQSVDLDRQRLVNLENARFSRDSGDFHSRLKATLKPPTKKGEEEARFIKNIITEAPVIGEEIKSLPGYISIIGNKTLHMTCRTCSLVSSSGQLSGKGAGADIDDADCVLRMNAAPVKGYEEDVGYRTTARIIGHPNLQKSLQEDEDMKQEILDDQNTRTDFVIIPWLYEVDINQTSDPVYLLAKNYSKEYPSVEFYLFTKEKLQETGREFERQVGMTRKEAHTWFSTGFVTMLFAIDICGKIDVYGLPPENYCQSHPNSKILYHYYNDSINKLECTYYAASEKKLHMGHKFLTEKAIFSQWAIHRNIRFHYPSWKPVLRNLTQLNSPFLKLYNEAKKNGTLSKLQNPSSKRQKSSKMSNCSGSVTDCKAEESKNYTVVRTFYKNGRRIVVKRVVKISKKPSA